MAAPAYIVKTAGATALAAATAKTLVNIIAGANDSPSIVEIGVSFDGVTASAGTFTIVFPAAGAGTALIGLA